MLVQRFFQGKFAAIDITGNLCFHSVAVDGAIDTARQLGMFLKQQGCALRLALKLGAPQTVEVQRADLRRQRATDRR